MYMYFKQTVTVVTTQVKYMPLHGSRNFHYKMCSKNDDLNLRLLKGPTDILKKYTADCCEDVLFLC